MCCVGDGRGRVGETLGRKPSRLSPKTEALAERSCRTAVLSGTAVERRTHPYTTKPSLGVPPLACAVGGGTCPDPMGGHPLHTVLILNNTCSGGCAKILYSSMLLNT